ncbi:MAG TPA: PAS domain-containing protein [Azospirillum sp.]|nr:PAS domain-containing protein [Azospirillum sp.]
MLNPRQLVFLVAAALLPVVLFMAAVVAHYSDGERRLIEERLRSTAVTAAATVDRQLAREIAAAQMLATSEALQHGDFATFDQTARRVLGTSGYWLSVVLTDETRQLVNTRSPYGQPLFPPYFREQIEEVFRTGRHVVSGVVRAEERITEPVVIIRVPVFVGGQVTYTLVVTLPAWTFNAVLGEHPTMPGGRLLLLDREDRVVARTLSPTPYDPAIAGLPTPSQRAGMEGRPTGTFEATTLDGTPAFAAFTTAPLSGWKVIVSVPSAVVQASLRQEQWALFGGGGLVLALAGFLAFTLIRSLTRRQRAERRLAALQAEKATERRLGDIATNFPGVIFRRVRHPDGTISYPYVSESVETMLGVPAREILRRTFRVENFGRQVPRETEERWVAEIERTARTLEPMRLEGELRMPDGATRRMRTHATTHRQPDGSVVWDGVMLDVTDLREAELAQREQTERLAFALDSANAGLWDWDIQGGRVTWSESLWRLLGYDGPQGEPTMDHLDRCLHPQDRDAFRAELRKAVESGSPLYLEFRVVAPDGTVRWLASIGRTLVDETGKAVRMTGLDLDVTERKRIEAELREAKEEAERANVTKSKFLAAASHDLRQPVQSLLFFIHVLGERLAGHPAQPLVGTMEQALDALKGLLDGILDLSKLDAGVIVPRIEPIPLAALLERLEAGYAPRFAAKQLDLTVVPCSLTVESDVTLLGRILGNLIENALKYTEQGGVLVGCRRRGRTLRIEVWDTGVGIPASRQEEIFDEFVQIGNPARDRAQGLGLGLAIVRRLAWLLGHRLDLRSRPGHGSVFTLEVPVCTAEQQPTVAAPLPSGRAGIGALVVIVDDEAFILEGMRAMLETWGYDVIDAQDAATALARVQAAGRTPAAVIADFRLRDGLTGVGAIATLRAAFGQALPGVLLTGDTGPALSAEAAALDLVIMHKPTPPGDLRRLMQELVKTSVAAD